MYTPNFSMLFSSFLSCLFTSLVVALSLSFGMSYSACFCMFSLACEFCNFSSYTAYLPLCYGIIRRVLEQ